MNTDRKTGKGKVINYTETYTLWIGMRGGGKSEIWLHYPQIHQEQKKIPITCECHYNVF